MTNFWLRVTEVPRERLHPKRVRPMCFLQHRRTDTIRSEQSDQTRQCLMQLHGIAQCCFEKSELLSHRTRRLRFQFNGNNRMLRSKVFQMRVQHPKKDVFVVGRLRNFENALVLRFVSESNAQAQFFGDEIDGV
jgi:hypothetical protein